MGIYPPQIASNTAQQTHGTLLSKCPPLYHPSTSSTERKKQTNKSYTHIAHNILTTMMFHRSSGKHGFAEARTDPDVPAPDDVITPPKTEAEVGTEGGEQPRPVSPVWKDTDEPATTNTAGQKKEEKKEESKRTCTSM